MLKRYLINPTLNIASGEWTHEGEVWADDSAEMKFDRAAQSSSGKAAQTAGDTAAQYKNETDASRNQLTPFYKQEMNAQHLYSPGQTNELLNFANAGVGGASATAAGQAQSEAARTRNTSGFSAGLDQVARDRQRQLSEANLGVGAQDIMGAKQLNQEGAQGMAGLNNLDTDAMLKSMGLQNQDLQTQVEAGKSGWYQNLLGGMNSAAGLISAIKGKPGGGGGGGGN